MIPQKFDAYLQGKVFKIKRKCYYNKHYIANELKLKTVKFANKFSFQN